MARRDRPSAARSADALGLDLRMPAHDPRYRMIHFVLGSLHDWNRFNRKQVGA
jgi:hypothetical protein